MNWLLLDTACPEAIVAVARDGKIAAQIVLRETLKHGERLSGAIEDCLDAASLKISQLNGIVVGKGPGSFVGVRIAMAQAKGIGVALQIPVLGVCTLSAMAAAIDLPLGKGIVFIDARRGEFYARHVERILLNGEIQVEPRSASLTLRPEELPLSTKGVGGFISLAAQPNLYEMRGVSAEGLLIVLKQALLVSSFDELLDEKFTLTPAYVRAPDAKIPQLR